jgi:hypothetical protein
VNNQVFLTVYAQVYSRYTHCGMQRMLEQAIKGQHKREQPTLEREGGSSSNTRENKSTPVKKVRIILGLILSIFYFFYLFMSSQDWSCLKSPV